MKTARTLALTALLLTSAAWAGAPVPAQLPATAQWAVHVDMEAVSATQMSKGLLDLVTGETSPASPEDIKKILEVWTWLGKVQSVTIYGSGFTPDQPVLLARLKYDKAEIEKMAHITEDNTRTAHGKHEIITLPGKNGEREGFGCFYNDDTILAGASIDRVTEALDLLDGKGKAMTSAHPLRAMLTPAKGSCVIAAATGFNKMLKAMAEKTAEAAAAEGATAKTKEAAGHAAILAKCTAARFEAGEATGDSGKNVFATLELTMETAEDAENVSLALQGIRALALMHLKEQETKEAAELVKLIRSLQAGHEGKIFGAAFEYPVADALEKMQHLMNMAAARKAPN